MTQLADERLIATLCDWWREGPVPEADAVIDDVRTLLDRLDAAGYEIVRKG